MTKAILAVALLSLQASGFFMSLYQDVNGRKAHEPYGFPGVVITILVTALVVVAYWQLGVYAPLGITP